MLNQEILGKYYVVVGMDLIRTSESFRTDFLKIASSIYADVVSYSQNANCSCKNAVGKFIGGNKDIVISMINNWDTLNPNVLDMDKVAIENKTEVVSGKVFYVDQTDEAYAAFVERMKVQKFSYRELYVSTKGDQWAFMFI